MKTRQGFVSNSSSSSFVICEKLLTKKQVEGLILGLAEVGKFHPDHPEEEYDQWGETGETWYRSNGYFFIETFYVRHQIDDLFEKLKIDWDKGISIQG
jgi:hypothetical protein